MALYGRQRANGSMMYGTRSEIRSSQNADLAMAAFGAGNRVRKNKKYKNAVTRAVFTEMNAFISGLQQFNAIPLPMHPHGQLFLSENPANVSGVLRGVPLDFDNLYNSATKVVGVAVDQLDGCIDQLESLCGTQFDTSHSIPEAAWILALLKVAIDANELRGAWLAAEEKIPLAPTNPNDLYFSVTRARSDLSFLADVFAVLSTGEVLTGEILVDLVGDGVGEPPPPPPGGGGMPAAPAGVMPPPPGAVQPPPPGPAVAVPVENSPVAGLPVVPVLAPPPPVAV